MTISAVTALYDIGRAHKDGRSIADYVGWLNKTLKLPVPFTVFLDPAIDRGSIHTKAGDCVISVPKEDFPLFRHRARVNQICAESPRVNRNDLTFKLPEYGILVMSKFEMIRRAAEQSDADGLLWMDAGLSRFFDSTMDLSIARGFAERLRNSKVAVTMNKRLVKAMTWRRLSTDYIGTSTDLINAGDIYVRRAFASDLARQIEAMVESEWLPNGLWDNEQVAMGYLLMRQPRNTEILGVTLGTAGLAKSLFGVEIDRPRATWHRKAEAVVRRMTAPLVTSYPSPI